MKTIATFYTSTNQKIEIYPNFYIDDLEQDWLELNNKKERLQYLTCIKQIPDIKLAISAMLFPKIYLETVNPAILVDGNFCDYVNSPGMSADTLLGAIRKIPSFTKANQLKDIYGCLTPTEYNILYDILHGKSYKLKGFTISLLQEAGILGKTSQTPSTELAD